MYQRVVWLLAGLALGVGGLGLTATFGLLSFIGMPLLLVGLACISVATTQGPITKPTH